jgi:hypothetical protein
MDYPLWQRPLREARSELVQQKVYEAEAAMFERLQQLATF